MLTVEKGKHCRVIGSRKEMFPVISSNFLVSHPYFLPLNPIHFLGNNHLRMSPPGHLCKHSHAHTHLHMCFILGIYPKDILAQTHEEYKDCSDVSNSENSSIVGWLNKLLYAHIGEYNLAIHLK